MTAINLVVQPKARKGFLISDTACTDTEGRLETTCGKVIFGGGRLPWAMGVSGNVDPLTVAQVAGEETALSLKQLFKRLPAVMRRALDTGTPPSGTIAHLLFIGAVWSMKQNRPVGFMMSSHEHLGLPGQRPFEVYLVNALWLGGGKASDWVGRDVDVKDPASFDPAIDGLTMVRAQRAASIACPVPGMAQVPTRIGGEIILTEVTKGGVKNWAIHDFGDPIGMRIDPARLGGAPKVAA